jgi:hypothetical protein
VQREFTGLCAPASNQCEINGFRVARIDPMPLQGRSGAVDIRKKNL